MHQRPLCLLLVCLFVVVQFCQSATVRNRYAFDFDTKWACFYRSSIPVKGLNPAIWRLDQYGNLLMAGFNYCTGCLCYTFDHRLPISDVSDIQAADSDLVKYVSSIENCQVLSYRANLLKGSNDDVKNVHVKDEFGCDLATMKLFEARNYRVLREMEKFLLTEERRKDIEAHYEAYVKGPYFLNPEKFHKNRQLYFEHLSSLATQLSNKITALIAKLYSNNKA